MTEPIHQRIEQHAHNTAEKIALICGQERLSYEELQRRVMGWRTVFARRSCRRVAVAVPNSSDLLCMFIAASRLNINFQILSSDWPLRQITQVLEQLAPDLIIAKEDICANMSGAMSVRDLAGEMDAAPMPEATEIEACDPEQAFYTGFTSGSTGLPKGFVRSQQSWLDSFASDQIRFQFQAEDCFVVMGSLSHSLPLYGALRGLYQGACVYMNAAFRPDRMAGDCQEVGASVLYATPTQYRALMDYALKEGIVLPSVRLVLSAGSKYPNEWLADLKTVFCNAEAMEFFGTSELSYVAARAMRADDPPALVGDPMPMVQVRILTADDHIAAPGAVGQIYVKSPFLFMGYMSANGQVEMPTGAFEDGYLSVGDCGHLDREGRLHIQGRTDRVFQVSGRSINPEGIEAVFAADERVQNAAVLGQADALREHKIAAVIKISDGAELEDILQDVRRDLPKYMIPTDIYMCEEWPLTHSHKTDYQTLKQKISTHQLERLK